MLTRTSSAALCHCCSGRWTLRAPLGSWLGTVLIWAETKGQPGLGEAGPQACPCQSRLGVGLRCRPMPSAGTQTPSNKPKVRADCHSNCLHQELQGSLPAANRAEQWRLERVQKVAETGAWAPTAPEHRAPQGRQQRKDADCERMTIHPPRNAFQGSVLTTYKQTRVPPKEGRAGSTSR